MLFQQHYIGIKQAKTHISNFHWNSVSTRTIQNISDNNNSFQLCKYDKKSAGGVAVTLNGLSFVKMMVQAVEWRGQIPFLKTTKFDSKMRAQSLIE